MTGSGPPHAGGVGSRNEPKITASDGEAQIIGAGESAFVEDTTGKGHLSKAVNERLRHSIFVTLN